MKEFSLAQNWWQFLLIAIVCYAIGCCNFAVIIARFKKRDITKMGSGNPGTMNMTREFGLKVGALTFFCDALKGGVPALLAYFAYRGFVFSGTNVLVSDFIRYFCGMFVVVGHIFPVQLRFHGGKGIASTLGLFWFGLSCESAWFVLLGFVIAAIIILFLYWTEWGALASLLGVTGCSIIQMLLFFARYGVLSGGAYVTAVYGLLFIINVLTWWAHTKNLLRLFAGEERRTSLRKKGKKGAKKA